MNPLATKTSALLFALATLTDCGGAPAREERTRTPDDGPVRLLDHLEEASVDAAALRLMQGELPPAAPEDLLLYEEFDGGSSWPGPWLDEGLLETAFEDPAAVAALLPTTLTCELLDGATVLRLPRPNSSLLALLSAPADESFLITARLKPDGTVPGTRPPPPPAPDANSFGTPAPAENAPATSGITWVPLRFDPRPPARLLAEAPQVAEEFKARPRRRMLAADADGWQELRLVAHSYPGRKAIAVSLVGGDGGVLVDRVEVRRLSPAESLALTPDDSVEPLTHPLRRRLGFNLETWDCLALPTPASATFEVVVPARRPRLEFTCSAIVAPGSGANLSFCVAVEGRGVLWESKRHRAGGSRLPLKLVTIDLAPLAGERVKITLSVEGRRGAVALFGAPTLLGAAAEPRSVLLISLDTLRADHVGCYGAAAARTSRIDRLAAEGVRFEQVFSPASYTLPSHLSMFSGQDPLVHETVKSSQPMDPVRTALLAQRMRDEGWRTAAFTGGGLVHPRYGFGVGFDSYDCRDPGGTVGLHRRLGDDADPGAVADEDRMARVVDWLKRNADQSFFLFVHTYLVHNYDPWQEYLDATGGGPQVPDEKIRALRIRAGSGDREAIERMHNLYRASVAQADQEIVGRLLDALDALDLSRRTLVVLVSDHGEEFFEHAMLGHGKELWHSLTRVPWIVRGPGVPRGVVREDPVALADVAPTIAAWAGLPPHPCVLAIDQLRADPDENLAQPKLLSLREVADRHQDALVLWPWKLVRRRIGEEPWPVQLFHLESDSGETRDLAAAEPARVAALTRRLDALQREQESTARALPSSDGPREFELPPELERMLDQLGYARDDR